MAKGLMGGMTDYNHQSFLDILRDLKAERNRTVSFRDKIQQNINGLKANAYWINYVPADFKNIVNYSLTHYNTTITELNELAKGLKKHVEDHHISRLNKIATVSDDINVKIGQIWHKKYLNKEYGVPDFYNVERIYQDTRDLAVNLSDIQNIASRLKDFLGYKSKKTTSIITVLTALTLLVALIVALLGDNLLGNYFNKSNNTTPGARNQALIMDDLETESIKDNDSATLFNMDKEVVFSETELQGGGLPIRQNSSMEDRENLVSNSEKNMQRESKEAIAGKNINTGTNYGHIGDVHKGIEQRHFSENDAVRLVDEIQKFRKQHANEINHSHITIGYPGDKESTIVAQEAEKILRARGYSNIEAMILVTYGTSGKLFGISNAPDNSVLVEIYPADNVH